MAIYVTLYVRMYVYVPVRRLGRVKERASIIIVVSKPTIVVVNVTTVEGCSLTETSGRPFPSDTLLNTPLWGKGHLTEPQRYAATVRALFAGSGHPLQDLIAPHDGPD